MGRRGNCGRGEKKELIVEEEGYIKRQKEGEGTSGRKKRRKGPGSHLDTDPRLLRGAGGLISLCTFYFQHK